MGEKKTKRNVFKRLRTKTVKGRISPEAHEAILNAANKLMLRTATVRNYETQPTLTELRQLIEPAYLVLANVLHIVLKNNTIQHTELCRLQVSMNPTLGNYTVRVARYVNNTLQHYNIHLTPEDGMTVFTRNIRHSTMAETGRDAVEEATMRDFKL